MQGKLYVGLPEPIYCQELLPNVNIVLKLCNKFWLEVWRFIRLYILGYIRNPCRADCATYFLQSLYILLPSVDIVLDGTGVPSYRPYSEGYRFGRDGRPVLQILF